MSYVDSLASAQTTSRTRGERLNQVNVLDKIARSNMEHGRCKHGHVDKMDAMIFCGFGLRVWVAGGKPWGGTITPIRGRSMCPLNGH